ncbi:Leucine-rich repeat domain superfamily [Sesbania bispinosa]|nr:Leucine-rich repeat domain superfamily [Sesbania bispinosa]
MALNVVDLASISQVCKSWNKASRDPTLWHKLDLIGLSSSSFKIPMVPQAWKDMQSSIKITQFMKYVLSLSNGNTSCLIFNYYVYLTDVHLILAAERTPYLKRLVLPCSGHLSKLGLHTAMSYWGGLESITITSMVNHHYIFSAIGKYCKNICQLKFIGDFEQYHANALVRYTPNLKALSIRNILVNMRALCHVLENLHHLEEINICHSLILDRPEAKVVVYRIHDLENHLNISCRRKLIFCQRKSFLRCKNGCDNNPRRQPYGLFEDIWREDEIRSLAH